MNVFAPTTEPLPTGPEIVTRRDVDKFCGYSIGNIAPLREPFTICSLLQMIAARKVPTGFPHIDARAMWRVGFAGVDVTLYVQAAADFVLGNREDLHARWHASVADAIPTQLTSAGFSSHLVKKIFVSEDWDLDALAGAFRQTFGDDFALIVFKTGQRSSSVPCEHQFNLQHFDQVFLHLAVSFSSSEGNYVAGWSESPHFDLFWARGTTNFPTTVVGQMNRSSSSPPLVLRAALTCLRNREWKVYESWIRLFRRHLFWSSTRRAAANTGNFDRRAQLADGEAKQRQIGRAHV